MRSTLLIYYSTNFIGFLSTSLFSVDEHINDKRCSNSFQKRILPRKNCGINDEAMGLEIMVWVYVKNWKGDGHMEHTKMKKWSIAQIHREPTSYAEAVI
jgi:hypothetical protein